LSAFFINNNIFIFSLNKKFKFVIYHLKLKKIIINIMDTYIESVNLLLKKIEIIEQSQSNLENKINEIQKNTKQMEEHINFVNNTYNKIKTPFHFLMDKVSLVTFSKFKKEVKEIEKVKEQEQLQEKRT